MVVVVVAEVDVDSFENSLSVYGLESFQERDIRFHPENSLFGSFPEV
jgi:hypothetical protein